MGLPCFTKVLKYGCLAIFGLAVAFTAIAVLSSPAAAKGGDGNDITLKSWDTDNLRYGSYNAQSFNIPFHKYGGYSGVEACQSRVADGFFQTDNSVVNDFPYLVASGAGNIVSWGLGTGSANNDAGCDDFVAQQDRLAAQVAAGVAYSLDSDGNLVSAPSGTPYTTGRSAADLTYGIWTAKGSSYTAAKTDNYQTSNRLGATVDSRYLLRVDGLRNSDGNTRAISPSTATWTVPGGQTSSHGNFGLFWHGNRLLIVTVIAAHYTGGSGHYECDGRPMVGNTCTGNYQWVWDVPQTYVPERTVYSTSGVRVAAVGNIASRSVYLTASKSGALCPSLFHPRGEDANGRIGGSTGRTLGGLTHALGKVADRYWCRSDLRYERKFAVEVHTLPAGITAYSGAPASGTFTAYGRLGCYYTTTGQKLIAGSSAYECGYLFPLPRCDSDKDGTADREYTAAEVQALFDRGTIAVGRQFSIAETARCVPAAPPPSQAGFTADACVTASLEIYENATAGSDAEPGIVSSDRTLAVASGRTAWDLDIASAHPLTASPPRDTGDASGCADGSENRADHSASPGGAARKQSPAPSYASSDRTDTAVPPNDADDDIDYSGAVQNIAHRYASKIAENTCAAKRSEARLRIAVLTAKAELYKDWMRRYKTWAEGIQRSYARWFPTGYSAEPANLSLGLHTTFYSFKHAQRSKSRYDYARRVATVYGARAAQADTVSKMSVAAPSVGNTWCGDPADHVRAYSSEVSSLQTEAGKAVRLGSTAPVPSAGPTSTAIPSPQRGSITSRTAGSAYVSARYRTTADTTCYTGSPPRKPNTTYTRRGVCTTGGESGVLYNERTLISAAIPEVKATATVNYRAYTVTVSGGGWSKQGSVAGYGITITCRTWRTSSCSTSATNRNHGNTVANLRGTRTTVTQFPRLVQPSVSAGDAVPSSLLGRYYSQSTARTNLENATAQTRNQAAASLGVLTISNSGGITPTVFSVSVVPAANPATGSTETAQRTAVRTAAQTYQSDYTRAYNSAYTQATGHMSGTSWDSFDWRYETSTLAWANYQEDPATAYSASTATPRDGTGCDLIDVAADGTITVEATRLDFETSSYGKANVYGTRTDAQRECKIRRTRTPQLQLMYAPDLVSGTDTAKTADTRLDTDSTATNAEFYYVNYQPTAATERFKLYDEAEVFAVRVSLADRAPVLCYQPGEALVAHVGAKDIDAVNKAVFSGASGFRGGIKKHCYKYPSVSQPAFAFFDDTAHSAMASVTVVWQQPSPKIVSKLGSTDDLKMMTDSVSLVASTAVPYNDAARTSSFYGTYYTFPADSSVKSPSGWDISGHPTLTLTSEFRQHAVQAKDTTTRTPAATHQMVFKFIDCVFGIEDVAFVDNIASPYAFLSTKNSAGVRVVSQGWKQTYDSDPHNSPTWYYPPFSTYQGALRLDGRRDSNGDPVVYRRNPQGGFPHPSYDLENTSADGIGWGIVYEDTVGKQQPVWAVYAPPVPGDNTQLAQEVCGATLGSGGANPLPTTGTPAARRIGTPATPPPATGKWTWKTSAWNYQDNPIMLWSADDDPDRDDPWETKISDSDTYLPRKPHNNLEFATQDSSVGDLDVFNPSSNGQSPLEDQDMVLANFAMVTLADLESDPDTENIGTGKYNPGLRERAQKGGITCGSNWWYCFRPAPAGYRLWGKEWMSKRQLCIGFNFKLDKWSTASEDALVSTLDNPDRNERGIPIRLRLGYIAGGIPTPGEPHPDSYYESSTIRTPC